MITRDYRTQGTEPEPFRAHFIDEIRGAYWILRVVSCQQTGRLRPLRLLGLFSLPPALTALIAWREDTLFLYRNGGRGLMEHLGWWAQYLACPVIVLLLLHIVRSTATILTDNRFVESSSDLTPSGEDVRRRITRWCCAQSPTASRRLRQLFMLGAFSVIANAQTTRMPESVYGEDVWDSSRHIGGYWAGKIFLTFEWAYLLPITAMLVFMVGKSVHYLVRRATADPAEPLLVFARDGCGGFRPLGQLMLQIVYLDVPIIVVLIFLQLTHEKAFYATLAFATALFVFVVLTELFLPFVPLHDALERLKERKLRTLEGFLATLEQQLLSPANGPSRTDVTPLMAAECVYRQTIQLNTWPYGKRDALKALTPFIAPVATVIVRLVT